MKVLAFDVGAKRMGACVLEGDGIQEPKYIWSSILGLDKEEDQTYQEYRLELIQYWSSVGEKLIDIHQPNLLASETIPLIGAGSASQQSVLAATAITAIQTIAFQRDIPIKQIAAVTVKTRIGRVKTATKPVVRDGVIDLIPSVANRKKDWTASKKGFDESDAAGVALTSLGYDNRSK